MARNYANILTAIWRDEDFRALSIAGQHAYLLLATQPDISAAGVLPLSVKRWSTRAKDSTPEGIVAALKELQEHRFVVFDTVTEELLVRSFVRWDGGATNPKRRPVILRAAADVESPAIRRVLAAEFERAGLPTDGLSDSPSDRHPDSLSGPEDVPIRPETAFPQVDRLSDSHPDRASDRQSPSDGVVVTQGPYIEPATHNPQSATLPPTAGAPRRDDPDENPTAQVLIGEWLDKCRKRPSKQVIGPVGRSIKAMLAEGIDVDDIRAGLDLWREKGLNPSALPGIVNQVQNARPAQSPRPAAPSAPPPIPRAAQCPEHRGQPADRCGLCRADRLARKQVPA